MEQATGRSSFTDQAFTDANTVEPFGSEQQWRIIKDDQGNPVNVVPIDKTAPGLLEHVLQQIPQYSTLKNILAGGKTYDTSSVVDAFRGDALMKDSAGLPVKEYNTGEQLAQLAGYSTTQFDLGAYQQRLQEERALALEQAIKRAQVA